MSTVIPVPDNWHAVLSGWDDLRHGYHAGDKDETVRDCARRLDTAAPGSKGDPVLFWTLGLLMLAPHVAFDGPGPGVEDEAIAVLSRVARDDDGRTCAHGWHPYEADVDDVLEHLPAWLEVLSSPVDQALEDLLPEAYLDELEDVEAEPANLSGPDILARWQCPRTAPGFARAALDYLGATIR
ncbi:hypothetical protein GCM10010358_81150 [Streptomyces minutiscleroticus]|uniref:Uncharacterized protein n=1 Tax=Streptomyces minutiscleroticus TaxID=68238 RepID=A0A918UAN5_9ACTN|nr:hypothetical protein [Streptomyces minutiscleroticus]GGY17481.1 hypothetical protein GCM10010358_81150 [Streptomyces minutiscleroticus]